MRQQRGLLGTVRQADRIIFLEKGQIIESDSHPELGIAPAMPSLLNGLLSLQGLIGVQMRYGVKFSKKA